MLLDADEEILHRVGRAWRDGEDRYVTWVLAHPSPRSEWLETANRLIERHGREDCARTMFDPKAGEP